MALWFPVSPSQLLIWTWHPPIYGTARHHGIHVLAHHGIHAPLILMRVRPCFTGCPYFLTRHQAEDAPWGNPPAPVHTQAWRSPQRHHHAQPQVRATLPPAEIPPVLPPVKSLPIQQGFSPPGLSKLLNVSDDMTGTLSGVFELHRDGESHNSGP